MFRQEEVNLKHIYDKHNDMERILPMYNFYWEVDVYAFLAIHRDSRTANNGGNRKSFDNFFIDSEG